MFTIPSKNISKIVIASFVLVLVYHSTTYTISRRSRTINNENIVSPEKVLISRVRNNIDTSKIKVQYALTEQDEFLDVIEHEKAEKLHQEGLKRMNDEIDDIMRQNNEVLPLKSYFGTIDEKNICEGDDSTKCIPKFQRGLSTFNFIASKKLLTCLVTKNMSAMLRATMCYLNNPEKFLAAGRLIHTELRKASFCKSGNSFWTYEMDNFFNNVINRTADSVLTEWKPFVLVRDPLDRMLSGYIDKCLRNLWRPKEEQSVICNGCAKNITCFLMREFERMKSPDDFEPINLENIHFFPQNWKCNFNQYLDKFDIVHYNSAGISESIEQLIDILRKRGIEERHLVHIREDLNAGRSLHNTIESKARAFLEKRVRESPFLMEFVTRMFYWDYKLFNYPLPKLQF